MATGESAHRSNVSKEEEKDRYFCSTICSFFWINLTVYSCIKCLISLLYFSVLVMVIYKMCTQFVIEKHR